MRRFFSGGRTFVAVTLLLAAHCFRASAQSASPGSLPLSSGDPTVHGTNWSDSSSSDASPDPGSAGPGEGALPYAPEPAGGGGFDHYAAEPAARWHQRPLSRIGFGADVSLLGIGLKSALELSQNFDVRVLGNYFSYPNANFKVEGFDVNGDVHFASASTSLDWYPWGSIFRISPGVMFYNQNGLSAKGGVSAGTSFDLGGTTYYSAKANPATGATPLVGTGGIGLNHKNPALMLTGGFGSFVPRSNRHWSFPSEFGVIFTGSPTVDLNVSGWACTDAAETMCTNVADPHNPIAIQFNNDLQGRLQHWRNEASKISVYPVFSYSVMYSFNIR
jgi:hypothetical protein